MDETRYVLNGICIEAKDNEFKCIATDGRRLNAADTEIELAKDNEKVFIVPSPAVDALVSLLSNDKTVVIEINASESESTFAIGDSTFIKTKLIKGQYPKWREAIPPPATRRHTFPSQPIIDALQRVSMGNHGRANAAKLTFHADHIIVSNGSSNAPVHIVEKIAHKQPDDAGSMPFECVYNPSFLTDGIAACRSAVVNMGLGEKLEQPAVLTGNDARFFYILMPMRNAE